MDVTARLAFPLLVAGQSQKEIFHNEALQRIDACIAASVATPGTAAPPATPVAGDSYLVAAGATGVWAGQGGSIAVFGDGGWRFIAPREGLRVWVVSLGVDAVFRAGVWDVGGLRGSRVSINGVGVVGAQQAAIADPAGGATVDSQARAALAQALAALRAHGLIAP